MLDEPTPLAARVAETLKARGQTVAVADGARRRADLGRVSSPGQGDALRMGGGVVYSLKGADMRSLDLEPEALKGMRSVTEPACPASRRGRSAIASGRTGAWQEAARQGRATSPRGGCGMSAVAVVGPGASAARTVNTGEEDQVRSMASSALAAIGLLDEAPCRATRRRRIPMADVRNGVAADHRRGRRAGRGRARRRRRPGAWSWCRPICGGARLAAAGRQRLGPRRESAIGVPTDITDPAALDRLAAQAEERFRAVALLINNAGIETIGLFLGAHRPRPGSRRSASTCWACIPGARAFTPSAGRGQASPAHRQPDRLCSPRRHDAEAPSQGLYGLPRATPQLAFSECP